MIPAITRQDLIKATSREDLIRQTAAQIIKDFAEFSLEVQFSGNIADFYRELFDQLKVHVEDLLSQQYERFLALLYRIDISNREIASYEVELPHFSYAEVITELIIHRELKKVMTRNYFKDHQP